MAKVLVLATSRHSHGGISSVVAAHEHTPQWKEHGCRWIATHHSGSALTKLAYLVSGMAQYLVALPGCDIVHIHTSEPPSAMRKTMFMRLAKLAGKKTIVHFHAFDTSTTICGPHADVYRRLFTMADRVVVLSPSWQKAVAEAFPEVAAKTSVLYNPCPEIADAPQPDARQYSSEEGSILTAGVITDRKGYRDLIAAFARVAQSHPHWRLTFAGSGEIDKAKQLADDLGVADRVDFLGWVAGANKDRAFRQSSIFCLPSYAEGFPMAVLDAWAYALPVAATPVGGLPDIVSDGADIMLFNPGDTEAMALALEKLISDTDLRKKIAQKSNKFAKNTFNILTIGRRLGELYNSLK